MTVKALVTRPRWSIADQTSGLEVEALLDPIDHLPGRVDLLRAVGRRCLDVDNDPSLQIDEVVGRVGVEGRSAGCRGPASGGVGERDDLRCGRRVGWLARVLADGIALLERCEVLAHRAARTLSLVPVDDLSAPHAASTVGIRPDDAGINRRAFATDQAFTHAAAQHA